MEIKIKTTHCDGSKTKTFKSLKGAQKYAHEMVGVKPEISVMFGYAVGMYGLRVDVWGDATLKQVFPEADFDLG
jgi:hypothetical protein